MPKTIEEELQSVYDREYRSQPIAEHEENLRKLSNLILRLKTFTIWEIREACKKEDIGIFSASETLEEYLESLVTVGLLRFEFQTYTLKD